MVLQPDWVWNEGRDGYTVTLNYKSSLTIINSDKPAIGDEWTEDLIPDFPEGLIVIARSIKSVGGGDGILTLELAFTTIEELSWITVDRALERHPGVSGQLTAAQIAEVKAALLITGYTQQQAARNALASAKQKKLFDYYVQRIDSWQLSWPMITKTSLSAITFPDEYSPTGGNVISSPDTDYLDWPLADERGDLYTYVAVPEVVTIENGVVVSKKQWIGFVGVEDWLYEVGSVIPDA